MTSNITLPGPQPTSHTVVPYESQGKSVRVATAVMLDNHGTPMENLRPSSAPCGVPSHGSTPMSTPNASAKAPLPGSISCILSGDFIVGNQPKPDLYPSSVLHTCQQTIACACPGTCWCEGGASILDQHHLCGSSLGPELVTMSVVAEHIGRNFDEYMTVAEHVHHGT